MPLQNIEPEIVELTAWPNGYMADPDPALVPVTGLLEANNLLPTEAASGGVKTRKGIRRFGTFVLDAYTVKALHAYSIMHGTGGSNRFLIAVVKADVGGAEVADNLQIIAINTDDGTWSRIDDSGRPWIRDGGNHFGVTVDNVFYGGGERDPVYAWRPYYSNGVATSSAIAWDPDATMPQRAANNWTLTTVYSVHDRVEDGGFVWACHKDHTATAAKRPKNGINAADYWTRLASRFDDWSSGTEYKVGDKVMRNVTGDNKFPRGLGGRSINTHSAFIASRDHTSSVDNGPPSWAWEPFRAPVSNVGSYHGSRLFMRDSDTGTSRVRYSGRVKTDGLFNPSDWEATDIQGPGFFDIRTGDGDDVRALAELGNMLVICKRRSTHVLAGLNPSTWALRQIAPVGCISKRSWAELDGVLFFMSDEGLMMTDGSLVQPIPGSENVNQYVKANIEFLEDPGGVWRTANFRTTAYDGKVLFTLPHETGVSITLVYDPVLQSFWPQDFTTWQFAIQNINKVDQLFLGSKDSPALVLQYNHPDAGDEDDTRALAYASQPIPWHMRTGWLNFGTANEDRKLRRTWARVRATAKDITLKAYKNFSNNVVWTVNTLLAGPTGTVEGKKMDNAQSIGFRIEGASAPTTILGMAAHTQFRRKRYHRA